VKSNANAESEVHLTDEELVASTSFVFSFLHGGFVFNFVLQHDCFRGNRHHFGCIEQGVLSPREAP
jgi:hypothetical protein